MYTTLILAFFSLTDVSISSSSRNRFFRTNYAVLGFSRHESVGTVAKCQNLRTKEEVLVKIKGDDSDDEHHDKAAKKVRSDFWLNIREKVEDEIIKILWGPPLAPPSSHGVAAEEAHSGLPQRSVGELAHLDQDPASC